MGKLQFCERFVHRDFFAIQSPVGAARRVNLEALSDSKPIRELV